jgi:hypothetical protein
VTVFAPGCCLSSGCLFVAVPSCLVLAGLACLIEAERGGTSAVCVPWRGSVSRWLPPRSWDPLRGS